MKPEEFCTYCTSQAKKFGLIKETEGRKKQNVVIRRNLGHGEDNVPYFAFISPVEATSGPYSDFSLVFLPAGEENDKYVMTIGVGSEGFRNDFELATTPGMRRVFLKLLPGDEEHHPFCKPKFTDIESVIDFSAVENETNIRLYKYRTVMMIGCLIDTTNERDLTIVNAWLAQYAAIRKWASTEPQRKAISKAVNDGRILINTPTNNEVEIKQLLKHRRFVVLQGAPGTGKTYLAEKISQSYDEVFFTQFHAETTYSDFVYGIFPKLNSKSIEYEPKYGELCEAIKFANDHPKKQVILIIDEINRANLANVLGPVFYLFEPKRTNARCVIKIGDRTITTMPENLAVIATMNTADRSIAVVDFALRRRFAWYTVKPERFNSEFIGDSIILYEEVAAIFEKYASDYELNLQPGGAYFMARTQEELKQKIQYELMPLIKEYIEEGLLTSAAGEFSDLFYRKIQQNLFE